MEFFLPFSIQTYPFTISYHDKIFFIGSCFSEQIGDKMIERKFDVLQNPNGILYDPLSISDALFSYIENKHFDEENLFELNGLWHSWKHHSSFSGVDRNEVLKKINLSQSYAHDFLKETKFLIITFGTAFNYLLKNDFKNVANCHKAPSGFFRKNFLPLEEIKPDLLSIITAFTKFNPDIKIIFTISPVRHISNGIIENNRSKARLIEATHFAVDQKENVFYFPAYELVMDILRDYRFFKNDLVHPNEAAIDLVFEKFMDTFLDTTSKEIMSEIENLLSAIHHKPFFKESDLHQKFVSSQLRNIRKIESKYPFLNFSKEKKYFEG